MIGRGGECYGAVLTATIRVRFDCNSTALRPFDGQHVTTGLLRCGLNKQTGQRDCGWRVSGRCYVAADLYDL